MDKGRVQDQGRRVGQHAVQGLGSCSADQRLGIVEQRCELRHHIAPDPAWQAVQAAQQLLCAGLGMIPAPPGS